jgi:hypothetical protein
MFFASLRINDMVGLIPLVETIPKIWAKHAMLLVDAVEERANMTLLTESTPSELQGMPGVAHVLTSTRRVQRREPRPSPGTDSAPPSSISHVAQAQPGSTMTNGIDCMFWFPELSR